MKFYSECGEDKWLYHTGRIHPQGAYVDIGAAWPLEYSNTAMVRELGWHGIQVDGCECYKPLWDKLGLELIVAVVSPEPTVRFAANPDKPNLSKISIDGSEVKAENLNELLRKRDIHKIDLLSVDVEGSEHSIVSTLDFEIHQPSIIIWEYNTLGAKHESLCEFLEKINYQRILKTECNYVHIHDSFRPSRIARH